MIRAVRHRRTISRCRSGIRSARRSGTTPPPAPSSTAGVTPSSYDPNLGYLDGSGTISNGSYTPFGGSAGPIPGPPDTGRPNVAGQQAANNANAYQNAAINKPPGTTPTFTPTAPTQPQLNPTSILDSFPGASNALALENQGFGQQDAALQQARDRLIISFGDPALASMAGFGLDPQAGAFAQQNYLSGNATLARLNRQHQLASQGIVNALAAHGILNSGDLGYREGQENQNYGNTVYDAQQQVLQQLADLYNGYLSNRASLENNVNAAYENALSQYIANPDAFTSLLGGGTGSATNYGNGGGGLQNPPKTTLPKPKATTTNYNGVKGPAIGSFQ